MPASNDPQCALVLAGGDGSRLRELTRRVVGDDRPKQFCPLLGRATLLEETLHRVGRLIPCENVRIVLQREHAPYYTPLLSSLPSENLVVQPANRGTAPAILYGVLKLGTSNLGGPLAIFPSDHYVSDDERFMAHVDRAFQIIRARPDLVVLLGVAAETPEQEFGWIEPGEALAGSWPGSVRRVRRFWEKPPAAVARRLMEAGCLWNTFVLVAYPFTLLTLVRQALPSMVDEFIRLRPRLNSVWELSGARHLYSRLPTRDFSTHILAGRAANLAVLRLDGVGWSDLGRPGRVLAALSHAGTVPEWADHVSA
jgi:mannose-1-phosphate guanylyltransferase